METSLTMIVGSHKVLEIGSVRNGYITDERMEEVAVGLKVIREVTRGDYIKFCMERKAPLHLINTTPLDKFYEIEILD